MIGRATGLTRAAQALESDYTLGDWRAESLLHVGLVKTRLTRSLAGLFPAVMDEIGAAYTEEITSKLNGNGAPYPRARNR